MISSIYNKFRRITTNQLYFPEIDGIRFLAISLVLLFHLHGYFVEKSGMPFTDSGNYSLLDTLLYNGDRGVELFFVLSGFILCLPFAHQYISQGKKVQLKKYYLRRVTRLEPPYIIAMTGIFVLQLLMHVHTLQVLLPSWLASLVYVHGAVYHHTPLLTVVAWSLEIEIQFYLLAPLFFSILALPKPVRRLILSGGIVLMVVMQRVSPPTFLNLYGFAQYFFCGILLSDFYVSNTFHTFFNQKWMVIPAAIALLGIAYVPIKDTPLQTYSEDVLFAARMALPFLICLFYYMVMKNDALKKVFGYKALPIIGGMCYSVYLLHYTIISAFGRFTMGLHVTNYYLPNLALQIVLLSIPVLVISSVFYLYIERPFMSSKWMDMLMKRRKKDEPAVMESDKG
jgi:peptidoglycan/LPS O-acetylase OafA/YrhL